MSILIVPLLTIIAVMGIIFSGLHFIYRNLPEFKGKPEETGFLTVGLILIAIGLIPLVFILIKKLVQKKKIIINGGSSNKTSTEHIPAAGNSGGAGPDINNYYSFFDDVGKSLQDHKVNVLEKHEGDNYWLCELKGTFKEYPVKIVNTKFDFVKILLKAGDDSRLNPFLKDGIFTNMLDINRNPDRIPVKSEKDDPWNKIDSTVFLSKGIFIEGSEKEINYKLRFFQTFSPELQAEILDEMGKKRISTLSSGYSDDLISIVFNEFSLSQYEDSLEKVTASISLLMKIADEIKNIEFQGIGESSSGSNEISQPVKLVSCSYCSTRFPLTREYRCPNCGASCS